MVSCNSRKELEDLIQVTRDFLPTNGATDDKKSTQDSKEKEVDADFWES